EKKRKKEKFVHLDRALIGCVISFFLQSSYDVLFFSHRDPKSPKLAMMRQACHRRWVV
ncbi:unnamed protein product, partial [Linum tenue]